MCRYQRLAICRGFFCCTEEACINYEPIFGEVSEDGEMPSKSQKSIWVTDGQKKQSQELGATHAEVYAAGLKALSGK